MAFAVKKLEGMTYDEKLGFEQPARNSPSQFKRLGYQSQNPPHGPYAQSSFPPRSMKLNPQARLRRAAFSMQARFKLAPVLPIPFCFWGHFLARWYLSPLSTSGNNPVMQCDFFVMTCRAVIPASLTSSFANLTHSPASHQAPRLSQGSHAPAVSGR